MDTMVDYVVSQRFTFDDNISAAADAAAGAMTRAANAADTLDVTTTRITKSANTFRNQLDPVSAAVQALQKTMTNASQAQQALESDMATGATTAEQYSRAMATADARVDAARARLAAARAATLDLSDATVASTSSLNANTAAVAAATDKAAAYQATLNAALGVRPADNYAARAADIAAYGAEMDRLRAKYDPLFAASKRYSDQVEEIGLLERTGVLNKAQAGVAMQNLTQAYSDASTQVEKSTGHMGGFSLASAGATREMLVLGHEAVTGNFSRIPGSLIVMAERAGGLQDIIKGVGAAVTSTGGIVAIVAVAAVGAFTAMAVSAEHTQSRITDLQNTLRATRVDYANLAVDADAAARKAAALPGLNITDAREGANALANTQNFTGGAAALTALLKTSLDLSVVLGDTVPKAAAILALALKNPAAEAQKLADTGMPGFSASLVYAIKLMEESGNKASAFAKFMDTLNASVQGARQNVTPFRQALDDLVRAFSGDGSSVGGFFTKIGDVVLGLATNILNIVTALVNAVNFAAKEVGKYLPGSSAPQTLAPGQFGPAAPLPANTSITPAASADIYRIAEQRNYAGDPNLSAVQADFATRVASVESGGHQLDRNGGVLTSSAGALGRMQLMPGTAAGLGVNASDAEGNTDGGLKYIAQLWAKYNGDPNLVAMAYNWGPGNVDKFLAGTKQLPTSVQGYANKVTGASPADLQTTYSGAFTASGSVTGNTSGAVTDQSNAAFKAAQGQGTLSFRQDANVAEQNLLQAGMNTAAAAGDVAAYEKLAEALRKVQGAATDLIPEQTKLARTAIDALAPLDAETGATRDLATIRQKYVEVARKAGVEVDEIALIQDQAAELAKLSAAHRDAVAQIDRNTAAQNGLASAYDQGARSVVEATNRTKAEEESRKTAVLGTKEYRDQVDDLTGAYNRNSAAKAGDTTRALGLTQQDDLDRLKLEISLVGQSTDATTAQLAILKEKQRIIKDGGPEALYRQESQDSLARVAQIQAETTELHNQQQAMTELGNIGTSAFDKVGTAITQAFATGTGKAIDFGTVFKGVLSDIAQQILKLAILNPVMNELLGGQHRSTLSDIGGVLGKLVGNDNVDTTATDAGSSLANLVGKDTGLGNGTVYNQDGNSVDPADLAGKAGGGGGVSLTQGLGILSTGYSLVSKLLGGSASSLIGSVTDSIGSYAAGTLASLVGQATSATATNLALAAAGQGVVGVATPAQFAAGVAVTEASGVGLTSAATDAAVAVAANAGVEAGVTAGAAAGASVAADAGAIAAASSAAIGAATSTVLAAVPFVGAAVSIITDLASGNYRGAALVLAGALIGTAIAPGIGTAVGVVIGGLIDAFLPSHPKNPYQNTEVDIQNGQISAGKTVSQIESTDGAVASVQSFSQLLAGYMGRVGITLANADGKLGDLGNGIKGMQQNTSVSDLFNRLRFQNNPDDTSNFGVAKDSLKGMVFQSFDALNTQLGKIAAFADTMTALGLNLATVGQNLTNIQIASVSGGGKVATNPDGSIQSNLAVANPLRVALQHDLPGQTFANVDALSAEIDKVNTFVNGTIPGLLNPILKSTSQLQTQVEATNQTYGAAIKQATTYGLDTQALLDAQTKADDMILASARAQLDTANAAVIARRTIATQGASLETTLQAFDTSATAQRLALAKSLVNVYGDSVTATKYYGDQMLNLDQTLAAERLKTERDYAAQATAALLNVQAATAGITARGQTAAGNTTGAALTNYDVKAAQEQAAYSKTLTDFYGWQYASTVEYGQKINALTKVQESERAAIITAAGTAAATAFATAVQTAITDAQSGVSAAQTAFNAAQSTLESAINGNIAAVNAQIATTTANTTAIAAASASLRTFVGALPTSAQSPLPPSAQLAAAGATYSTDLAKIGTGGAADQAGYVSAAQTSATTLLTQAASYFGKSSADYALIFSQVQADLSGKANSLDGQGVFEAKYLTILQQQLAVQTAQLDAVKALGATPGPDTTGQAEKDMLVALRRGLVLQQTQIDATNGVKGATTAGTDSTGAALDAGKLAVAAASRDQVAAAAAATLKVVGASVDTTGAVNAGAAGNTVAVAAAGTDTTKSINSTSTAQVAAIAAAGAGTTGALKTVNQTATDQVTATANGASGTALAVAAAGSGQVTATAGTTKTVTQLNSDLQNSFIALTKALGVLAVFQEQIAKQAADKAAADAATAAEYQAQQAAATASAQQAAAARAQQKTVDDFGSGVGAYFAGGYTAGNSSDSAVLATLPKTAPDAPAITAPLGSNTQRYELQLNLQSRYSADYGRLMSQGSLDVLTQQIADGLALPDVYSYFDNDSRGARAAAGYASGGFVANGTPGRDSVMTALAGGEYVIKADQTARFADILPSINAGTYRPANDDVVAELRALRVEVAALRADTARVGQIGAAGSVEVAKAVREGQAAARQASTSSTLAARRKVSA